MTLKTKQNIIPSIDSYTYLLNCQLNISTWMSNRHLQLNTYKT